MKIILFGVNEIGKKIFNKIVEYNKKIKIVGFCDIDLNLQRSYFLKHIVYSPQEVSKMYKNKYIDAVILTALYKDYDKINDLLNSLEMFDIYAIPTYLINKENYTNKDYSAIFTKYIDLKPQFWQVEVHLAEHCNLSCKGCGHFSNIIKKEIYKDYNIFKRDLKRLSGLIENTVSLYLLGGEPLLNNELAKYIKTARYFFPYTKLSIVTNGLLITKLDGSTIEAIRNTNTKFEISEYPPTILIKDKIIKFLENKNIPYLFRPVKFSKFINSKGDSEKDTSFKNCWRKLCYFLGEGEIAACPLPFVIKYYNKAFNEKVTNKGKIDLYSVKDGYELIKILKKPMEICKYCTDESYYEWCNSKKDSFEKEDWCVT